MKRILIAAFVLALVGAACASDDGGGDLTSDTLPVDENSTSAEANDEPIPTEPDEGIGDGSGGSDLPVVSPELTSVVDLAVADLMKRLSDSALIEVLAAHELTWPNGSLGCPQPDMNYTDALVDGYRIELSDGDTVYHYHGALGETPFLCEDLDGKLEEADVEQAETGAREETGKSPAGSLSAHVDVAVSDLTERLGIDPADVRVMVAETVTWSDGSFGCPEPDMSYTQALAPGVRVQLVHEDESYWYHQGGSSMISLCEDPGEPVLGDGGD